MRTAGTAPAPTSGTGGASGGGGASKALRKITAEEVAKHNTKDDCWVIVGEQVLDCTNFLADHPGGAKAIVIYAGARAQGPWRCTRTHVTPKHRNTGRDATEAFDMMHERGVIPKYAPETVIGTIAGGAQAKL